MRYPIGSCQLHVAEPQPNDYMKHDIVLSSSVCLCLTWVLPELDPFQLMHPMERGLIEKELLMVQGRRPGALSAGCSCTAQ